MTIKTFAEFDAEYAAAREKLQLEHDIAERLGVTPDFVSNVDPDATVWGWATYKRETLQDAIDLLALIRRDNEFSTVSKRVNGSASVRPVDAHYAGHQHVDNVWVVDDAVELTQNGGKGWQTFKLAAYLDGIKVIVDFKSGIPAHLRAYKEGIYNRAGDAVDAVENIPSLNAEQRCKWATGSKDSYHVADYYAGLEQLSLAF